MQRIMLAAAFVLILTGSAMAVNHAEFMQGPYEDGMAVTRDCLKCHKKQAQDFLDTAHWLWKGPSPHVVGLEPGERLGKRTLMNNF